MWITFGLNHSVGGNCAENVWILGGALSPRFLPLRRNSLASNEVFSETQTETRHFRNSKRDGRQKPPHSLVLIGWYSCELHSVELELSVRMVPLLCGMYFMLPLLVNVPFNLLFEPNSFREFLLSSGKEVLLFGTDAYNTLSFGLPAG